MKKSELKEIVTIQIQGIQRLLEDQKIAIELSPAAQERIVTIGYDPAYGARPLKRAIRRELQNPIATMILDNTFTAGDKIIVDCVDDKLTFDREINEPIEIDAQPLESVIPAKKTKNAKKTTGNQKKSQSEVVSSET